MKQKRITWIDQAKGIEIVLVVLGHVVSSYHETGLYKNSGLYVFLSQFVYSFHMPLFIFISGYLASKCKKIGYKGRRCLQLVINYGIPYVLFSALWVGMKMVLSDYTNGAVSFNDLLLIPKYPISFMWFIYVLLFMQILQVLCEELGRKGKAIHLIIGGGGVL